MCERAKMVRVAWCIVVLVAWGASPRLVVADITWDQAQEILRNGEGVTREPALDEPVEDPQAYGAEANPTGNPIGGGTGYEDIKTAGDYTVGSKDELLDALEEAQADQVVYVKPDARIDLTDLVNINIPDGVILAGNRGKDGSDGPLIFTGELGQHGYPSLFVSGTGSRVTGLRLKGPDPDYADYTQETKDAAYEAGARAIVAGVQSEVDNCEISNFYRDGVAVNVRDVHVHHNFIHDIAAYPVVVGGKPGTSALIEANMIHWGWHAMAGSGKEGTGYEARYNVCIPHAIPEPFGNVAHCLDQHGDISISRDKKLRVAGDWLQWHHNTLVLHGPSTKAEGAVGMRIRGTPRKLARVYNNWFKTTNVERALGVSFSNAWIYDNVFGPEKQKLAEINTRTTPQIVLKTPGPPTLQPRDVTGKLELDFEVNVLDPLRLAGVLVKFGNEEVYLQPHAPASGQVTIDTTKVSNGDHKLSVAAVDNRGVLAVQELVLVVAN